MQAEERHWTTNDELIERFILNQLEPEERNELEDHLRICEVCKRAVRAEQMVVAGIRRAGREQFKAELRKKASLPEKQTPWVQILSAAAAIVILLTVGIYNRWFENQLPQPSLTPIVPSEHSQAEHEKEVASPAIAEQSTHSGREASASARPGKRITDNAKEGGASTGEAPALESERYAGDTRTPAAPTEAEVGKDRDEARTTMSETKAGSRETAEETVWIEGTVYADTDIEATSGAAIHMNTQESNYYQLKKSDAQPPVSRHAPAEVKQTIVSGSVVLSQQNSVSLPPTQQRLRQLDAPNKVMTKVERVGNITQLTLYLDSLINDKELKDARLEAPTSDSLIVHLPDKRISYRISTGLNIQFPQPTPAK